MKYILLILLFVTTFSFSQKREYVFDYIIKYEITFHNQNFTQANYYLTNSKDNSYFGIIHQTDSLQFELTFRHHDEAFAKVKLLKSDFYRVEYINIACENVLFSKNIYKYQTKNYDFHILKDTLIKDKVYGLYTLEYNKKLKKKIRKGIGTNYYIIDNSTNFHLPILEHPTAFEEWKLNKILPNGIFDQLIFFDSQNKIHTSHKLISFFKIDKKIMILGDCPEPIKFGTGF